MRTLIASAMVALTLVVLPACGGDDEESDAAPAVTVTESKTTGEATPDP